MKLSSVISWFKLALSKLAICVSVTAMSWREFMRLSSGATWLGVKFAICWGDSGTVAIGAGAAPATCEGSGLSFINDSAAMRETGWLM